VCTARWPHIGCVGPLLWGRDHRDHIPVTELGHGRHDGKECRRQSSFLGFDSRSRRYGIRRATGHFSSVITMPPRPVLSRTQTPSWVTRKPGRFALRSQG
jgi:hypothetical protein